MLFFAPANMDQVAEALDGIGPNRPVEIAPGVPLSGVRTVSDLLALGEWPPGLRLVLEDDGVVLIDPSQRGFRSGLSAPSTPWLGRFDRPSSIVAPNRNITEKKSATSSAAAAPPRRPEQVEMRRAGFSATTRKGIKTPARQPTFLRNFVVTFQHPRI